MYLRTLIKPSHFIPRTRKLELWKTSGPVPRNGRPSQKARCSESHFSDLQWVLLTFPLRIWDTGTLPACRHYDKEKQNWELDLLLLHTLPCIPLAGPDVLRGCTPLEKLKLARNSKSQHSAGCRPHCLNNLCSWYKALHIPSLHRCSHPAGLWPNMLLFPLLTAFSLPTHAVREQEPPWDTDSRERLQRTVTDDRRSVGALESCLGFLPQTSNGCGHGLQHMVFQKCRLCPDWHIFTQRMPSLCSPWVYWH